MNTSQETSNLFKAMIEAAPEITSITKSKQAYGYKYATLDNLIDMLRCVLPKHGLWFIQMPTREGDKSTLTTRVVHASGEWMEDKIEMTDTELQGKVNDTQRLGASITYFRRYALSSIFGVAADEDVDGNLNSKAPQETKKSSPKAVPAQSQTTKKQDPLEYMKKDQAERLESGEGLDSIVKYYADILKTDAIRQLDQMNTQEITFLATTIYKQKNNIK